MPRIDHVVFDDHGYPIEGAAVAASTARIDGSGLGTGRVFEDLCERIQ